MSLFRIEKWAAWGRLPARLGWQASCLPHWKERKHAQKTRGNRFRPIVDRLEDRLTPSTLFVDSSHIDCPGGGSGTAVDPFCSISAAAAVAVAGDTVQVASGTYQEMVTVRNSGAPDAPIVFTSAPGAEVTVTGGFHSFLIDGKSWIAVNGFNIEATSQHGIRILDSDHITITANEISQSGLPAAGDQNFAAGIYFSDTTDAVVSGNVIHNNTTQNIRVAGGSRFVIADNQISRAGQAVGGEANVAPGILFSNVTDSHIEGNTVHHNSSSGILIADSSTGNEIVGNESYANARALAGGSRAAAGIDIRGPGNFISGNISHDNEDTGVQVFTSIEDFANGVSNKDNIVVSNISYNNGDHGIDALRSSGATIVGNTVYNNLTAGINVEGGSVGATIANNISMDNGIASPRTEGNIRVDFESVSGTALDADMVFISPESETNVLVVWGTAPTTAARYTSLADFVSDTGMETHGIEADPLFADAASGDFRLQAGSPAIDSADSAAPEWLFTDAEGNVRVDDPRTADTGFGPRSNDDRGALEFQPPTDGFLYVNPLHANAADSGPGTPDRPLLTIGAALDLLGPGDVVFVSQGVYSETVRVRQSGTPAAPIVFRAAEGAEAVVGGGSNGFRLDNQSWIAVQGFVITGTDSYGIRAKNADHLIIADNDVSFAGRPAKGETAKGIYLSGVSDSLVANNIVHHNSDDGIYLTGGSTRIEVSGNTSYENARGYVRAATGIKLNNSDHNTVAANVIHDNEDSGVEIRYGHDNLIVNNLSHSNGDHGVHVLRSTGNSVIGNTAADNVKSGIIVEGGSTGTTVVNNISAENGIGNAGSKGNISVDSSSFAGTILDYNLVWSSSLAAGNALMTWGGVGYDSLTAFQAASGMEAHGIEADPLFVDAAAGDYRLAAGSPAIDAADSGAAGQQAADADGNLRVDDADTDDTGAGPRTFDDRGAFEFQPDGGTAEEMDISLEALLALFSQLC